MQQVNDKIYFYFYLKSFFFLLDDSDEELFRRTGNYLTKSTVLRAGTIDCLRCADFKHDVAHSVCFIF
jgi:hypothetical protein